MYIYIYIYTRVDLCVYTHKDRLVDQQCGGLDPEGWWAVAWITLNDHSKWLLRWLDRPDRPVAQILSFLQFCGSDPGAEAQILSFPRFSLVFLQFCGSGPAVSWVRSGVRGSDPQFSIIFVGFPAVLCGSDRGSEAQILSFPRFSLVLLQFCGSGPAVSWVRSGVRGSDP